MSTMRRAARKRQTPLPRFIDALKVGVRPGDAGHRGAGVERPAPSPCPSGSRGSPPISARGPASTADVISVREQARLAFNWIVAPIRRSKVLHFDIGSGNTKGGFYDGRDRQFIDLAVAYGTKSMAGRRQACAGRRRGPPISARVPSSSTATRSSRCWRRDRGRTAVDAAAAAVPDRRDRLGAAR